MTKRPFMMALLAVGAIFVFFLGLVLAVATILGDEGLSFGEKVAVIEVYGVIESSDEIIAQLKDFRDDDAVKAIVLRIDSPGGGVAPSQEIHEEVVKTVAVKPVVVSMGSVAASGGYYIAAPARRIFANPGTITGSIGAIMEFTNFQLLLEKIGLRNQVVKSGRHKDIGSPIRPMSVEDRRILQSMIDDVHEQFIDAVAAGRKLEIARVRNLADGRIFSGKQAQAAGLVDTLGNLQDAIASAAELGGIQGEPEVVYPPRPASGWLTSLVEGAALSLRKGIEGKVNGAGLHYLWPANP